MATLIANKWYAGTIYKLENFISKANKKYIRVYVVVKDSDESQLSATLLCSPTLIPGSRLFNLIRICDLNIGMIDELLKPALFIGKPLKVKLKQSGSFFNVSDFKKI